MSEPRRTPTTPPRLAAPKTIRDLERDVSTYDGLIAELLDMGDDPDAIGGAEELEKCVFSTVSEGLAPVQSWMALQRAELERLKHMESYFATERRRVQQKLEASDACVHRVLLRVAKAETDADLVDGQAKERRVKTDRVNVGLVRKGGKRVTTVMVPAELLPVIYQKRAVSADVSAINAALEAGAEIPGCELEPRGYRVSWGKV